jgi:hypothetical protein
MSPTMSPRVVLGLAAVVALFGAAGFAADEPKAPEGLQAVITTADDEQTSAVIAGLKDGQLQLATEPPRTVALNDVARIDVGEIVATAVGGADLLWMGQDNHDLVQVGGASGGNGVQDLHLHAANLRAVGLKQITVVCRLPGQLRVWRLDTSQSPHWRLAIARADLAPEAELYLEPASVDSFGQKFEVKYTYTDDIAATASVVATTHTSDQRKIDRRVRAGTAAGPADAVAAVEASAAEVYLADSGILHGDLTELNAETLTIGTKWGAGIQVPLLQAVGVWFGSAGPAGGLADFQKQMAGPGAEDQVFVLAPDKTMTSIQAGLRGLTKEKLNVRFEGEDRSIDRNRVLGVVFAAHPPLPKPDGPAQVFVLSSGDLFSGKWVGLADNKLEIELPWNARVAVPAKEIGQIRVRGGRVTSLVDLEPVAVEEVPYFGRAIPWRRDSGFDGEPPKLRGKQPMRSLAMHSRCVLTYALDEPYEKFKATLGFDDSAANRGRVDCRVLVDGREAFARQDFRAESDPLPIEVSVAGAKQLALEVDFGLAEDVGDRILWAEPRLFRASEK